MVTRDKTTRKYGIAVFAASLLVYAVTACRTVYVGDSGELTLALMTGGIAHPPGIIGHSYQKPETVMARWLAGLWYASRLWNPPVVPN